MTVRLRSVLLGLLLLAGTGAGWLATLRPLLAAREALEADGEPIYLPSKTTLRALTLGHRTSVADLMYLWSIQYFGEPDDLAKRSPWIARVYDAITDLDPHFKDAYYLGFISTIWEGRAVDAGFRLVDKALEHNPDYAMIGITAAMTARSLNDDERTLHYLEKTHEVTGDPMALRFLLKLRTVDTVQQELAAWRGMLDSDDPNNVSWAERHVRDLEALIDLGALQALVDCHSRQRGRPPATLDALLAAGYLEFLPTSPDGHPFSYDPSTGFVSLPPSYKIHTHSTARRGVDLSMLGNCDPAAAARKRSAP